MNIFPSLLPTIEHFHSILPKEIVEKYAWKAKQKLTIEDKGRGSLVIRDWKSK